MKKILLILFIVLIQYGYSQDSGWYEVKTGTLLYTNVPPSGKSITKCLPGKMVKILRPVRDNYYYVQYQGLKGYFNISALDFNVYNRLKSNTSPSESNDHYTKSNDTKKKNPQSKSDYSQFKGSYLIESGTILYKIDPLNGSRMEKKIKQCYRNTKISIVKHYKGNYYLAEYQGVKGYFNIIALSTRDQRLVQKGGYSSNPIKENQKGFIEDLPPILNITDITFSDNVLDANEIAFLTITINNVGPGDAKNVYVILKSNLSDLIIPNESIFPIIRANGGSETITIKIKGGIDLTSSEAVIEIQVVEPNFKVKIQGKKLIFQTKEFSKPKLILAKYALIENQSVDNNNQVDINEIVDLKFAIQNIGQGDAKEVQVEVTNNQIGVMLLGVDNNNNLKRQNPYFDEIQSGKFMTVVFRYFVNSEFNDEKLIFKISVIESTGRFRLLEEKSFPINKQLKESGYIRKIVKVNDEKPRTVVVEDVPDFVVDVDRNIPVSKQSNNNTYALIIGNEDYTKQQPRLSSESNVDFAKRDAQIFALYAEKTLGIPKENIILLKDATSLQMQREIEKISKIMLYHNGEANIIFYYAGHGFPDETTKESYLMPVDVSGADVRYGIKLNYLYQQLTQYTSQKVLVILDACFSGGGRNLGLLAARGVKIKPKENVINGNLVVFSSSSGEQSSLPYQSKQHGMFTYFLLKKLQESKGDITLEELSSYVTKKVQINALKINSKEQNPNLLVSPDIGNLWMNWGIK